MNPRRRRRVLWLGAAAIVGLLLAAAVRWRPIAARIVTMMALRDAAKLTGGKPLDDDIDRRVVSPLLDSYGAAFRLALLDRVYCLQQLPETAVTPDCAPALAVIWSYLSANHGDSQTAVVRSDSEVAAWMDAILLAPKSFEIIANALSSPYTICAKPAAWTGSVFKWNIFQFLFLDGSSQWVGRGPNGQLDFGRLTAVHWSAILEACHHPREKVRAGALLLLARHPSQQILVDTARRALTDPSPWVRLAAAGLLAHEGDVFGAAELISGLADEHWEVRFWCCDSLKALPRSAGLVHLPAMRRLAETEKDEWLQPQAEEFVESVESTLPRGEWQKCSPADVGLDLPTLEAFQAHVGGRGCVVRYGFLAHAWGDIAKRGDIASAAKPIYTYFLFKAIHEGRLRSLDDPVRAFEPRLVDLNETLLKKDAGITWRHLASQTSCYGVNEPPGAAFDYSDFNIALYFDTLFLKVYGVPLERLDREVLHAKLTDRIGCQDDPTFFAFGTGDRPGRIAISVRDFARFGLLYARKGRWGADELAYSPYVELATSSPLPNDILRTAGEPAGMIPNQRSIGGGSNQTDHLGSYSFTWWTNGIDREGKRHWPDAPADTFGAFGHGGVRALVVIPGLGLVASWNDSPNEGREKEAEALRLLVKAAARS